MRALWCLLVIGLGACASTAAPLRAPPLPAEIRSQPARFVVVTVRNDPRPLGTRAGATLRGYDGAGLYGVTSAASATVRALSKDYELRAVSAWPIAALRVHCVVFEVPENTASPQVIAQLARDPRVDSAQPLNQFATESADAPPQTGYNDPYANLQTVLRDLTVEQAQHWSRGAGVRIAIVDTGIDFEHPDLAGQIVARRNFVDGDDAAFRRDRHGTAVAGVIGAVPDNHIGIVGIAPDARLLALKACWQPAQPNAASVCNSFTLAQALQSAIDLRADIVNLSLGGPADPLLERLVRQGMQRGMIFVGALPSRSAAAGFPTGVAGVLSVAQSEDTPALGPTLDAPGHEVLTLVPEGHWDFVSGSSIAAAEVSATVALILAQRPHMRAAEVEHLLAQTSRSMATPSASLVSVNACAALAQVLQRTGCESQRPAALAAGAEPVQVRASVGNRE
jgi:subtilisin family serine protease